VELQVRGVINRQIAAISKPRKICLAPPDEFETRAMYFPGWFEETE